MACVCRKLECGPTLAADKGDPFSEFYFIHKRPVIFMLINVHVFVK